jgi:thymidylate synthase
MEFKPLYFGDRLTIINPQGTIGVVTLWSRPDYVIDRFRQAGVDLDPATSPIAVFGNLYGNGLREMLRNLLYNPQIWTLLICGHNRSGSKEELVNFFEKGLEPVTGSLISYKKPVSKSEVRPCLIRGTKRVIDSLVNPSDFQSIPRLIWGYEDLEDPNTLEIFKLFCTAEQPSLSSWLYPRKKIELPEVEVQFFPSNPRSHLVVRDGILDAWKEVLYLLSRFGRRVILKKGERLELQHVKVVVETPRRETLEQLRLVNMDITKLRHYEAEILRGILRKDEAYNYGHRMRAYFGLDTLAVCAARLREDPGDRKSYVTLWDNTHDLGQVEGRPCLVSLYFRKFDGKLTLSATFRTHNAMDAYPMNLYGLTAIQGWVAKEAGLAPGAIVVISHSLGLDPKELDRAMLIIGKRPFKVRLDPMGYFRVTLDGKEILVEHRFEDVTLKEYRGKSAVSLQHQIARDVAISDINHAIYLGRQLAKAEMALKDGREFVQD